MRRRNFSSLSTHRTNVNSSMKICQGIDTLLYTYAIKRSPKVNSRFLSKELVTNTGTCSSILKFRQPNQQSVFFFFSHFCPLSPWCFLICRRVCYIWKHVPFLSRPTRLFVCGSLCETKLGPYSSLVVGRL